MSYTIFIQPKSNDAEIKKTIVNYYSTYKSNHEDSGIDLVIPYDIKNINTTQIKIDHCIAYALWNNEKKKFVASYLYPRSSTSKTNFRLANLTGIIDKGYRGNVFAKVDIHNVFPSERNIISKGTRLFQICAPDLEPIEKIELVTHFSKTKRGENGFGSTGK